MINFCDEWECDGCGNIFDKTELVDSIQLGILFMCRL